MAIRRVPIRRIGNRVNLVMGADRELIMTCGLISGVLAFATQEWIGVIGGIALWTISLSLFRKMGKSDPRMRHVYLRQLKYGDYYPARSTPFRKNTRLQGKRYR